MKTHALVPLFLAAQCAVAAPIDDPWALVPELPSSCYSERDDYRSTASLSAGREFMRRANQIFSMRQSAPVENGPRI